MEAAIPLVVILDDVLDAHKALLARLDVFEEVLEVAMCLAAAVLKLLVVVGVPRHEVDYDLICDQVLPVGTGHRRAVAQHGLGRPEVRLALVQKVFDLRNVSTCRMQGR